jgi:hypothetical protein
MGISASGSAHFLFAECLDGGRASICIFALDECIYQNGVGRGGESTSERGECASAVGGEFAKNLAFFPKIPTLTSIIVFIQLFYLYSP